MIAPAGLDFERYGRTIAAFIRLAMIRLYSPPDKAMLFNRIRNCWISTQAMGQGHSSYFLPAVFMSQPGAG